MTVYQYMKFRPYGTWHAVHLVDNVITGVSSEVGNVDRDPKRHVFFPPTEREFGSASSDYGLGNIENWEVIS